jgi:hypothetical protein
MGIALCVILGALIISAFMVGSYMWALWYYSIPENKTMLYVAHGKVLNEYETIKAMRFWAVPMIICIILLILGIY